MIFRWAPSNIGPYSQAKTLGKRVVLVSGQIALDPPTMVLGGGGQVVDEAKICLSNLEAILKVCGSSISDGVRLTAYVVSMGDAKGALEAWREAGGRGSANAVCVRQLPRGAKVMSHFTLPQIPWIGNYLKVAIDCDVRQQT